MSDVKTIIAKNQYATIRLANTANHRRIVKGYFANRIFGGTWGKDMTLKDKIKSVMNDDFYAGNKHYYITSGTCACMSAKNNTDKKWVNVGITGKEVIIFWKKQIIDEVVQDKFQRKLL